MEREALVERLAGLLARHPEVVVGYLFGSRARGAAGGGSDLDLAILLDREPPHSLDGLGFDLRDELAAELGVEVDLVVLNRAPADLVHRVLRDGILVVERDRARRIAFEVAKRSEYFDLEPVRKLYRGVA